MQYRRAPFEGAALGFLGLCVAVMMGLAVLKPWMGIRLFPSDLLVSKAESAVLDGVAGRILGWKLAGVRTVSLSEITTLAGLDAVFEKIGYDWRSVVEGGAHVPRFYLAEVPAGLDEIRAVGQRKRTFFKMALPLVLRVNEALLIERKRLLRVRDRLRRGRSLTSAQQAWLDRLREIYGEEGEGPDELLLRVDAIPPSLALAQAAKESGWGTSRFAREGNALFGQRTWNGGGMLPVRREAGQKHRVKAFGSLIEAVWAYAYNLNTHPAYEEFRRLRAEMRESGAPLDGPRLAGTLTRYSEQRGEYVEKVRTIIRINRLAQLDTARLRPRAGPGRSMPVSVARDDAAPRPEGELQGSFGM